jgi:hypothetical protein
MRSEQHLPSHQDPRSSSHIHGSFLQPQCKTWSHESPAPMRLPSPNPQKVALEKRLLPPQTSKADKPRSQRFVSG